MDTDQRGDHVMPCTICYYGKLSTHGSGIQDYDCWMFVWTLPYTSKNPSSSSRFFIGPYDWHIND